MRPRPMRSLAQFPPLSPHCQPDRDSDLVTGVVPGVRGYIDLTPWRTGHRRPEDSGWMHRGPAGYFGGGTRRRGRHPAR